MFAYYDFSTLLQHIFVINNAVTKRKLNKIKNKKILIDSDFLSQTNKSPQQQLIKKNVLKNLQNQKNKLKAYFQGSYFQGNKRDYQAIYQVLSSELQLQNVKELYQIVQDKNKQFQYSSDCEMIRSVDQFYIQVQSFLKENEQIKKCIKKGIEIRRALNNKEYQMIYEFVSNKKNNNQMIIGKSVLFTINHKIKKIIFDIDSNYAYILDIKLLSQNFNLSVKQMRKFLFWCLLVYCSIPEYTSMPLFCYAVQQDKVNLQDMYRNIVFQRSQAIMNIFYEIQQIEILETESKYIFKIAKIFRLNFTKIQKNYDQYTQDSIFEESSQKSFNIQNINQQLKLIEQNNLQSLNKLKYYCLIPVDYFSYRLTKDFILTFQNYFYLYPSREFYKLQNSLLKEVNENIVLNIIYQRVQPQKAIVKQFSNNHHIYMNEEKFNLRKILLEKIHEIKNQTECIFLKDQQNQKFQEIIIEKNEQKFLQQEYKIDNQIQQIKQNKQIHQQEIDKFKTQQKIDPKSLKHLKQIDIKNNKDQYQKSKNQQQIQIDYQQDQPNQLESFNELKNKKQNQKIVNDQIFNDTKIFLDIQNQKQQSNLFITQQTLENNDNSILNKIEKQIEYQDIFQLLGCLKQNLGDLNMNYKNPILNISFYLFLQQIGIQEKNKLLFVLNMHKQKFTEEAILLLIFLQNNFFDDKVFLYQKLFTKIKPEKNDKFEKKMTKKQYFVYKTELYSNAQLYLSRAIQINYEKNKIIKGTDDEEQWKKIVEFMWSVQSKDLFSSQTHSQEFIQKFLIDYSINACKYSTKNIEDIWEELVQSLSIYHECIHQIVTFYSILNVQQYNTTLNLISCQDLRCFRLCTVVNTLKYKFYALLLSNTTLFFHSLKTESVKKLQEFTGKILFTQNIHASSICVVKEICFLFLTLQWSQTYHWKTQQYIANRFIKLIKSTKKKNKTAIQQLIQFLHILNQQMSFFDFLRDKNFVQTIQDCINFLQRIEDEMKNIEQNYK